MVTKEERNARARDNQRVSRARRLDYITSLEEKLRHFETVGVSATQQVQASARSVEKQNAQLRRWLCQATGVREADIQEWFRMPADSAERSFVAHLQRSRGSSHAPAGNVPQVSFAGSTAAGAGGRTPSFPKTPSISQSSDSCSSSDQPYGLTSRHSAHDGTQLESVGLYGLQPHSRLALRRSSTVVSHDSHYQPSTVSYPATSPLTSNFGDRSHQYQYIDDAVPQVLSNGFVAQMPSNIYHEGYDASLSAVPSAMVPPKQAYMSGQQYGGEVAYTPTSYPQSLAQTQAPGPYVAQPTGPWQTMGQPDPQFPNFLGLMGTEALAPKCGRDLGPEGQQFCSLLSLLAPSVSIRGLDPAAAPQEGSRQLTCRESYQALQHILGDRMSVEEVVGRLMHSARSSGDEEGSHVDVSVVKGILDSIGLDRVAGYGVQGVRC